MVVLFVTPGFPERNEPLTGFPAYLYRVSLALIDMGHKPIILTIGQRNISWTYKGIEVIQVGYNYYTKSNDSINFVINSYKISYRLNREIKKLVEKVGIDIIQFTSLRGVALLYYGKTPAVMRLSSYAKTYFALTTTHTKNYVKTMAWVERSASKRCNVVFAPSKVNADAFGKDVKRNIYVIETPFVEDVESYDDIYIETELKDKKYVLFFGVLLAEKGIKIIAQCLQEFLEKNKDYYFVFVGRASTIDGENAVKMLKRCAGSHKEKVIALPALLHQQLYPIIQNAEFVVLPSLMENFSNACIEAMYLGKVVIGTRGASFDQLITHKKSGILCQIGDAEDLLNKMQMVVNMSDEEKKKIGELARQRIDKLKPEYVVKNLLQLYEYVIENSKTIK